MKDFKWKDEQMDKEIKDKAINTLKLHTLMSKCWHRSPNTFLIQKGRNTTIFFLNYYKQSLSRDYLFNSQKFNKQKAFFPACYM